MGQSIQNSNDSKTCLFALTCMITQDIVVLFGDFCSRYAFLINFQEINSKGSSYY